MKTKILLLTSACFFLTAPIAHLPLFGVDDMTMMKSEKIIISDSDINSSVKQLIVSDVNLSKFNIDVKVDKGVVTLGGKVDNAMIKSDLEKRVAALPGVVKVVNNIVVVGS